MSWSPERELEFDIAMALRTAAIRGLRLSPEEKDRLAAVIAEHLRQCRWRFERDTPLGGHGTGRG
jgi:hypothetical protein